MSNGELHAREREKITCTIRHIGMRIFLIENHKLSDRQQPIIQMAMQIEFNANHAIRPDDGAHVLHQIGLAIIIAISHHGAMQIEQYYIQPAGGG